MSNGSFFPLTKTGSCAWIIATPDGQEWISGGGIIPGEQREQNSYRSELGGALGVAAFMECIQLPNLEAPEKYHVKYYCDGLPALQTVNTKAVYIKSSGKSVDLISMTSAIWLKSNFTVSKKHVYAHQDDTSQIETLTMESILNCKVDLLAKQFALEQICSNKTNLFKNTTLGLGTVTCSGKLVSSQTQKTL